MNERRGLVKSGSGIVVVGRNIGGQRSEQCFLQEQENM